MTTSPGDRDPIDDDPRFVRAAAATVAGEVADALALLDELVAEGVASGDDVAQAKAGHLGATVARVAADGTEARQRAQAAVDAAVRSGRADLVVTTRSTQAEVVAATGNPLGGAALLGEVVDQLDALGHQAEATVVVLRQAEVLGGCGQVDAAADLLAGRAEVVSDEAERSELLLQAATHLQSSPHPGRRAAVHARARELASSAGARGVLAQLDLLDAARALDAGDPQQALDAARAASAHALEAVHPMAYLGAALTQSAAADALGDRDTAYRVLATGWATLSDATGAEAARAAFEPRVEALRARWGEEAFGEVKARYEARRRAEIAQAAPVTPPPGAGPSGA